MKNRLQNQMGDQLINDRLIVYIEKDVIGIIKNETII